MKTDNELIAEFMGLTRNPSDGGRTWGDEVIQINGETYSPEWNTLKYHKSWDWLMPVVEKIEDLGFDFEIFRTTVVVCEKNNPDNVWFGKSLKNKFESTYRSVVEFIKWHNLNKN